MSDTSTNAGAGGEHGPPEHAASASKLEWAAAAVGLVLVVGMVAFIAYYALTTEAKAPAVTVEVIGVESVADAYLARFRAKNRSSATAAALRVEGELRQGQTVVESSQATLDYLPPFSERRGGLFFQQDPRRYELRIAPKGYAEP